MLRAALFDLDGTLVHTNIDFGAMKRAVIAAAGAHGVDASGYAARDSLAIVRETERQLGAAGVDARAFASDARDVILGFERASLPGATEADEAARTLAWLRARDVRVGIVTRNARVAAEELVRRFGLAHDALLTHDDVPHVKPDPSHLHAALARLGAAAKDAIMVGDHVMDIVAGRAAGVRALAIAHADHDPRAFEACPPDAVIRSFAELRAFVLAL